jgi:hypothetical protein
LLTQKTGFGEDDTETDVLKFFRDNLPEQGTFTGKRIPLEIDDVLQDYTDLDDVIYAIERFEKSILSKLTLEIISPGLKHGFSGNGLQKNRLSKYQSH